MNVTVYVPEELRAEINKRRDALNLSEIFQGAIETALARLEMLDDATGGGKLDRLRASKEVSDAEWAERGERMGMRWALAEASYDELVMVAGHRARLSDILPVPGVLDYLPTPGGDSWEADVFPGGCPNTEAFVRGYVAGVGNVYDGMRRAQKTIDEAEPPQEGGDAASVEASASEASQRTTNQAEIPRFVHRIKRALDEGDLLVRNEGMCPEGIKMIEGFVLRIQSIALQARAHQETRTRSEGGN